MRISGIECPYCKEKIKSGATKCGHCQSEFDEPIRDRTEETLDEAQAVGFFAAIFVGGVLLFYFDKGFWFTLVYVIVTAPVVMVLYMFAKGGYYVVLPIYKGIKRETNAIEILTNILRGLLIIVLGIIGFMFLFAILNILIG